MSFLEGGGSSCHCGDGAAFSLEILPHDECLAREGLWEVHVNKWSPFPRSAEDEDESERERKKEREKKRERESERERERERERGSAASIFNLQLGRGETHVRRRNTKSSPQRWPGNTRWRMCACLPPTPHTHPQPARMNWGKALTLTRISQKLEAGNFPQIR